MRLLVLTILFQSSFLMAQDYLITNKGDTLKGTIQFQLNGKIESALVKGSKRANISAVATQEVVLKGKRYKPVQFNGNVLFMEIITDGYLSLLAFQPPNIMSYDGRLLQKRDGKLLEVPNLSFKKQMANYLIDYPDLSVKIQNEELGRKDLNEIIKQYNDFISGNTEVQKVQAQVASKQLSKTEILNALKSEIEKTELPLKQDALDILSDWADKIQSGKPAMPYMLKALKSAISSREDLLAKLDDLLLKN